MSSLRDLCDEGAQILVALIEATPETVSKALTWEEDWSPRLVAACEPMGDVVGQFSSLSPMEPEEQRSVWNVQQLSDEHHMALCCHATRMHRLRKLLDRLPVARERKKKRHPEAIEEACRLYPKVGSSTKAAIQAVREHGKGPHKTKEAAEDAVRKEVDRRVSDGKLTGGIR